MRRELCTPRPNWPARVESIGMSFHTMDGKPYWNEAACYRFDADEIDVLENATNELHELCLAAVNHVVAREELGRLGIPDVAHAVIARAWERRRPALYGRFDFSYDGSGPPKLLEYNADTPTSLLEAAVVQWHWLQDVSPEADQFNSIWEGLIETWQGLLAQGFLGSGLVHFGCMDAAEDFMTTAVLMDTAVEAGLEVDQMLMTEIGWVDGLSQFVRTRVIVRSKRSSSSTRGSGSSATGSAQTRWRPTTTSPGSSRSGR